MSAQYAPQGRFRSDGSMSTPPSANRQPFYNLTPRQQPEKARVVVRGKEKDRKPIDPPPIIQFHAEDDRSAVCPFLHNPYYFCCCTLWDEKLDKPAVPEDRPGAVKEVLVGQVVSSLHRLKDFNNEETAYFVFGDVSVAVLGKYRLRFSVYEFIPRRNQAILLQETLTEAFEVVSPKDWDGVRESTALSRAFADQGVRLRLRKESTKRAYGQSSGAGSSTGPQTPLRPHPSHPGSYGSPSDHEQDAASEPSFKRQRSFQAGSGYQHNTYTSQPWQPANYGTATGQTHTPTPQTVYGQSGYQSTSSATAYSQSANPYAQYGHAQGYRAPQQSGDSYYPSYPPTSAPTQAQSSQAQQYASHNAPGTYMSGQSGYPSSSGAYYNTGYATLSNKYPGQATTYTAGQAAAQPISYGNYGGGGAQQGQDSQNASQYAQYTGASAAYPYRQQQPQSAGQTYQQSHEQPHHSMANPSTTPRLAPINRGGIGGGDAANDASVQGRQQRLSSSGGAPLTNQPY